MADKQFINGVFIKEHKFPDGGRVLNVRIPVDKVDAICAQLKSVADDGWVKLVIGANRQPTISKTSGKVISTHSMSVDEWKPGNQPQASASPPQRQQPEPEPERNSDDVPF